MKVLIAVPTYENILPDTFKSIWDLEKLPGVVCDFEFIKGYGAAKARNDISKIAIDKGYDYVLMIDSDMIVPKKALTYMLEDLPDICLGLYPKKNTRFKEVEIFKLGDGDFVHLYKYEEIPNVPKIDIKGGGFGCALINTEVFKNLKYPYFKYVEYENGALLSEDLYFCDEAGKAGYSILADTRVRCGHSIRGFQYE